MTTTPNLKLNVDRPEDPDSGQAPASFKINANMNILDAAIQLLKIILGSKGSIPSPLIVGQEFLSTDTQELFIGAPSGNIAVGVPVFNSASVRIATPHMVVDTVTLSGPTQAVTLTGDAVFSNANSYFSVATGAAHPAHVTQNSGSSLTIGGTTGDQIYFICVGN
jgi:hypothetical protein